MAKQATGANEQQLKQRSMRWLALALALIVLAIVGLGLLDHYSGRKQAAAPGAPSTEPPPIASLPQPKPLEPDAPAPRAAEVPAAQPAPALPPPPPPSIGEEGPAASQAAGTPPQPPAAARPGVQESGAARTRDKPAAPGSPALAGTVAPALESRRGFAVQLGVFTTVDAAQSLQARLKEQGIPAFLETRVVVGPFRDRAEAEAAQRKLKALGVGGVIVQRN